MANDQHTVFRSLHDLGLAAWFGGNLMGAIGVNKAAAEARDPFERTRLSAVGWGAWSPFQAAAIGAHLVGSVGMLVVDRGRTSTQKGARRNTVVKTALLVCVLRLRRPRLRRTGRWPGTRNRTVARARAPDARCCRSR